MERDVIIIGAGPSGLALGVAIVNEDNINKKLSEPEPIVITNPYPPYIDTTPIIDGRTNRRERRKQERKNKK